jgi:hypothetical protein
MELTKPVIAACSTARRRTIQCWVWFGVWLAVLATLSITTTLYRTNASRQFLRTPAIGAAIACCWVFMTMFSCLVQVNQWGLGAQWRFLAIVVAINSLALATLCSLYVHRIGIFAVVCFVTLLTTKLVWCVLWRLGTAGACVAVTLMFLLGVGIVTTGASMDAMDLDWAGAPASSWGKYLALGVSVVQMGCILVMYERMICIQTVDKVLYLITQLYLGVVYGWQVVWYIVFWCGNRRRNYGLV